MDAENDFKEKLILKENVQFIKKFGKVLESLSVGEMMQLVVNDKLFAVVKLPDTLETGDANDG